MEEGVAMRRVELVTGYFRYRDCVGISNAWLMASHVESKLKLPSVDRVGGAVSHSQWLDRWSHG